jgi:hypothetical protein
MHPNDPQGRRAFESPVREDPAPQAPESRKRDRTRYIGKPLLAAFVLLVVIIALILLL